MAFIMGCCAAAGRAVSDGFARAVGISRMALGTEVTRRRTLL